MAKDGGYYQKYGSDATLVFGVHPAAVAMVISGQAQMTNYSRSPADRGNEGYDYRKVIDNSVVARLVKEGFFEKLFGNAIKEEEEERKAKLAFR